ncbi:MAG: type IV toxin-antitoxin system AbiEi family antitoxin domain-containing protein [Actinomycetota bacterium]
MAVPALRVHAGGISERNRAYLEMLHRDAHAAFGVDEAARALGLDHDEAARLLTYFARRGWLSRVRRGLYVAVPLDARRSGEWVEDSWVIAARVFDPCYIGGWSACEYWDLTEQVFRSLLVVTAKKVHDRDVVMQGVAFHVTVRHESKLFGATGVWRGQTRVDVSDAPRTIVDILDDPALGGGIRQVARVVHEYFTSEHRNDDLLVEYGDRLGNRTVFKRLGHLLEAQEIDAPDLITACLQRRSAGYTTLDPSVKTRGTIVRRWGLRVNVRLTKPDDEL